MIVERLAWEDFIKVLDWHQGEHVSLIGPTGAGKTTLALALLPARKYTVAFGTKPVDATLEALIERGHERLRTWSDMPEQVNRWNGVSEQRFVLWPTFKKMSDAAKHQEIFREAMHAMFTDRSWCVFVDEVRYIANDLGLKQELNLYWLQGRSIGLSVIAATQRPVWVPPEMYTQATHLFFWKSNDRRDLDRIRDIAGPVDHQALIETVKGLDYFAYEVAYVNARTGDLLVTTPPKA